MNKKSISKKILQSKILIRNSLEFRSSETFGLGLTRNVAERQCLSDICLSPNLPEANWAQKSPCDFSGDKVAQPHTLYRDKKKIAIFDLTDCEGCELEFIALRRKLVDLLKEVEIVNWRLTGGREEQGPFDIAFVEGTPMTDEEREELNVIREESRILIALGACACLAGVQGIIDQKNRKSVTEKIYGNGYVSKAIDAKPIDAYVNVDFYIHGCPVNPDEIERFLASLLFNKIPENRKYPVCLECKAKGNLCFLVDKKPCLGPITTGGCGAICTLNNKPCVGCYGILKGANVQSMINILNKISGEEEARNFLSLFLKDRIENIRL